MGRNGMGSKGLLRRCKRERNKYLRRTRKRTRCKVGDQVIFVSDLRDFYSFCGRTVSYPGNTSGNNMWEPLILPSVDDYRNNPDGFKRQYAPAQPKWTQSALIMGVDQENDWIILWANIESVTVVYPLSLFIKWVMSDHFKIVRL